MSDARLPHISPLYHVRTVREFTRDLDFLLRYYQPVDLSTFVENNRSGKTSPKPTFLLSFDDGLRSFYDTIAPILLQKGVPAICFLNSDFVDNEALFFRYKAALLIDLLNTKSHRKTTSDFLELKEFTGDPEMILRKLKYEHTPLIDELASLLNLDLKHFLKKEKPYLTTDQIKNLQKQGFDFGAHSVDHPLYVDISPEAQWQQTTASIDAVTKIIQPKYKTFSFPFTDFGVSQTLFERLHREKRVDLTFGCAGQKADSAPHHYQRLPFEHGHFSGREIHNAEMLFCFGKRLVGKNTIHRGL